MIETAANQRIADAYKAAHAERGAVFAAMIKWVFSRQIFPLGRPVLTGLSRWA